MFLSLPLLTVNDSRLIPIRLVCSSFTTLQPYTQCMSIHTDLYLQYGNDGDDPNGDLLIQYAYDTLMDIRLTHPYSYKQC